ncbi:unnamed protein product [Chrysodeixis includens]|uniref:Uncharacterized protein n=1 Tax=Chrysodeixis includens TaxID=689277 RepID=A0A9N8Q2F1_CHRIL|nr:unnamed protein product [Chrysodeixis includens]
MLTVTEFLIQLDSRPRQRWWLDTATRMETSTEYDDMSLEAESGMRRSQHGIHPLNQHGSVDDVDAAGGSPTRVTRDASASLGASATLRSEMCGRRQNPDVRVSLRMGDLVVEPEHVEQGVDDVAPLQAVVAEDQQLEDIIVKLTLKAFALE